MCPSSNSATASNGSSKRNFALATWADFQATKNDDDSVGTSVWRVTPDQKLTLVCKRTGSLITSSVDAIELLLLHVWTLPSEVFHEDLKFSSLRVPLYSILIRCDSKNSFLGQATVQFTWVLSGQARPFRPHGARVFRRTLPPSRLMCLGLKPATWIQVTGVYSGESSCRWEPGHHHELLWVIQPHEGVSKAEVLLSFG